MTVWPSGLRRWLQAPVRKGVGSNPAAVTVRLRRAAVMNLPLRAAKASAPAASLPGVRARAVIAPMWNASVALCRPGAPAANVACGPAQASHRQVNQHQGHRCSQWPAGTHEHHATVRVSPTLRTWANMTVWPSGLRRWLQAPVRKGVGSNPTAVSLRTNDSVLSCRLTLLDLRC